MFAHTRAAFAVTFDKHGNWVTAKNGERVYLPFALVYEPSDNDTMIGVCFLWFMCCLLIRPKR